MNYPSLVWKIIATAIAAVASILLFPLLGRAQELPAIAADRPGQAAVPAIAATGTVEIAMGMQLAGDAPTTGASMRATSLPFAAARIGLLKTMELRLGGEFRSLNSKIDPANLDTTISGLASVTVGTRIGITPEAGAIPELSFQMTLGLPVGQGAFRSASVAPSFAFLLHNTLIPDVLNTYANAGAAWDGTAPEGVGTYAAAIYYNITPALSTFGEFYGAMAPQLPPSHSIDGGFAYLVNNNLQLDLFGGVGLTNNAADYMVSAGFAWRVIAGE